MSQINSFYKICKFEFFSKWFLISNWNKNMHIESTFFWLMWNGKNLIKKSRLFLFQTNKLHIKLISINPFKCVERKKTLAYLIYATYYYLLKCIISFLRFHDEIFIYLIDHGLFSSYSIRQNEIFFVVLSIYFFVSIDVRIKGKEKNIQNGEFLVAFFSKEKKGS
jgi:hypothetical protein